MKNQKKNSCKTGRREFLSRISAAAAASLVASAGMKAGSPSFVPGIPYHQQMPEMPAISLGPYRVSRLICGSNPFLGYSYLGQHTDRQMKEYFTAERAAEMLINCERAGITAHQSSSRTDYYGLLEEQGSKLRLIRLHSDREKISEALADYRPVALVHHGGVSDRMFAAGNKSLVHDYVKEVKDQGLLAGVSAHNPDVIKQIADEGWEVDFFMACFYNLTREVKTGEHVAALPVGSYNFLKDDPVAMTNVIKQVTQPCLAFKILGAGRLCSSQEQVRSAFRFAFENIKPTDGVIVGMFPWSFDEITTNVQYVKEFGNITI